MPHISIQITRLAEPATQDESAEPASLRISSQVTIKVPHDMDHNQVGREVAKLIKGMDKLGS